MMEERRPPKEGEGWLDRSWVELNGANHGSLAPSDGLFALVGVVLFA
jgi:hypothetical protein